MPVLQNVGRKRINDEKTTTTAREITVHIIYFVAGVLVSRGALLGTLSPFGASFAAAIPFTYMPAGLLGTALGYLLLSPIDTFRYIAVVISIGALRWVLNEFKKVSQNRFYPCALAFVTIFTTGVALSFSSSSEISEISSCLIESIISAAAAYFMFRASELCSVKRSISSFSPQEIACLSLTGCILLLSLSSLSIGNVSFGRILAVLVVLIASCYGGVSGGSIAGIATGIVFSLASTDMIFLCAAYSFSGLLGGLFAPVGKIAVVIVSLLTNLVVSFATDDIDIVFGILIECVIASAVFMILPKELGNFVANVFSDNKSSPEEDTIRRSVTMRLTHASKALENVSSCVNSVSDKLSKMYAPDIFWIYENAAEKACTKCGLRVYCWDKEKDLTTDDFHRLTEILKKNGFVKEKDIEDNFLKRCCRASELAFAINQSYKDFRSCEAAQRRITQVRSVIAGQFAGLSDILQDLSEEFENYSQFDNLASERVISALSSLGLSVVDCSCRMWGKCGMVVEIEIIINRKTAVSKGQVTHEVSKACGRYFESPTISFASDRARIVLCERPYFDVEIGSAQHIFENGELCGDCLNYFNNGMGSTVALISDGMGTGGRAAVDSNMAVSIMTKLIKAGLSYDCSLSVVNSSLMCKSEEESMATMDAVDFNLFTGKTEIMKAGACTTYIKKNSKLIIKEMPSLPIGILSEAKFSKEAITLSKDDLIVMISDGAFFGDNQWIEKMILSWRESSAQELASCIVDEAVKRRNDSHDDDITAIAIKVIENNS